MQLKKLMKRWKIHKARLYLTAHIKYNSSQIKDLKKNVKIITFKVNQALMSLPPDKRIKWILAYRELFNKSSLIMNFRPAFGRIHNDEITIKTISKIFVHTNTADFRAILIGTWCFFIS